MNSPIPVLRVQVVLYGQSLKDIWTVVSAVEACAKQAQTACRLEEVHLAFGDCSRRPLLGDADVANLQETIEGSPLRSLTYEFFDDNLGSAGGSNRLAVGAKEDFILVLNPDTYPAPNLLTDLVAAFEDPRVGVADARQIPIEHPKAFDEVTGDTSWVSGSCLLTRSDVFHSVGGFDTEHFFLYCDDVDYSWRVRLKGFRAVHVPTAVVFHDKRINSEGHVAPTALESYHGALGRLMLASRYGRPDILAETLSTIGQARSGGHRDALLEWERRVQAGAVPPTMEGASAVAEFIDGNYARHRF